MAYTFDAQIVSDLHKDAYGCRPSSSWWQFWNEASDDEKQAEWDDLLEVLEREMERERQEEMLATNEFNTAIDKIMSTVRCTREDAIRIYVDSLELSEYDLAYGASYICYHVGLPYSMGHVFVDAGVVKHRGL